jgi:hypothetical protein
LAASDKALKDLQNQRAGFLNSIKDIDKEAADEAANAAKEGNDKATEAAKKAAEDQAAAREKLRQLENEAFLTQLAEQEKILNESNNKILELEKAFRDAKFKAGSAEEIQAEKDLARAIEQVKTQANKQIEAIDKQELEKSIQRQIEAATRLGAGSVEGQGYDIVIEAAGTASALAEAADRCRPGGTIVLLGSYWDGSVEMPGLAIGMKELTIVPAVMYGRVGPSRDIDVAATILAQRPELPEIIVTHRFPLDAAVEAFGVAADRSAGAIKVVLEP